MWIVLHSLVDRDVLIEINLTSNDIILGVKGEDHPFPTYLKYGVPVTLSTDDECVARINLTHEYLRATQSYNLTYDQIKTMSRNSLTYSFVPGKRLWRSNKYDGFRAECADQKLYNSALTNQCDRFLRKNPKAALQWQLERNYINFERAVAKRIK